MAKKKADSQIDFPFYTYLKLFHDNNKKKVYGAYKPLTKKFLDFNNPENPTAYLETASVRGLGDVCLLEGVLRQQVPLCEFLKSGSIRLAHFEGREELGLSQRRLDNF